MAQQMQQPGAQGQYEFSARPALLMNRPGPSAQQFKDPYREYIKVAPQNIHFDRRVVRGNTFAALVIPVNMQPDPMMMQQQQKIKEMKRRRQMELIRHQQMEEAKAKEEGQMGGMEMDQQQQMMMQQQQQMQYAQQQKDTEMWGELSDEENMCDEQEIEPDFYIDRAPEAVFIPNKEGENKQVQVVDRDLDLFDFNLEVEPILQVLVGKCLEHARIEVIEDYEKKTLGNHKQIYKQMKESELMETQRVEAARNRKIEEIERRNMQMRTQRAMSITADEKLTSRVMAKNFLKYFKRDSLRQLVDLGQLRAAQDFALQSHYIPQLMTQAWIELDSKNNQNIAISNALTSGMQVQTTRHKQAILNEINRKAEVERQKILREKKEAEAKQQRKERRAALREQARIQALQEIIVNKCVQGNPLQAIEFAPATTPIYDVIEPNAAQLPLGVHMAGGLIGEILVSFACLSEYTKVSPTHEEFQFKAEDVVVFLKELVEEFPENCLVMRLKDNLEEKLADEPNFDAKTSEALVLLCDPKIHDSLGLRFMINHSRDSLKIMPEVLEALMRALATISLQTVKAPKEIPQETEAGPADPEEVERVTNENVDIEKENESLVAIQKKIRMVWPAPEPKEENAEEGAEEAEAKSEEEKPVDKKEEEMNANAFLRIQNYRDPPAPEASVDVENPDKAAEDAAALAKTLKSDTETIQETQFEEAKAEEWDFNKVSTKIILAHPVNTDFDINLVQMHTEACYFIRRHIIEKAKTFWALQLKDIQAVDVLTTCARKQRMIENMFEEDLMKKGFNKGEAFEDTNLKIVFKTFLKKDDARLASPLEQR